MQLEQFDAGDGEVYEEDMEATKEDLPPIDIRQVVRLEGAFAKGRRQIKVILNTHTNAYRLKTK
jgi:hypothetical protein